MGSTENFPENMTLQMKAVLFDAFGGPEVLYLGETEQPRPGPGELLVRVRATALNRADTLQRRGLYPPPPGESSILGLEMAGEVAETGPGVQKWKVGDAVCSLLGGGGYAEYAVIPENMALPVLPGWSWAQAASVPEAFLTAWQSLQWISALKSGERVLVHAGGSGVGTAAVQLARALGAEPWVTASASKHDLCRQLGAAGCIDYRTEDFSALLDASRPGGGVDVLLDCIGAPYLHQNLQVLRTDGRMVLLAMMGGAVAESLDLRLVLGKRLNLHGSTLRNRDRAYKERLVQDLYTFAWPRFAEGTLHPVLDCTFPLEEVAQAHRYMEENRNTGKIALLL